MYRYHLAQRFLFSRPINLLGIIGVMLGVWALIVVVSIFSGYINEVWAHVRMTTSDLVVLKFHPSYRFANARKLIMADPNVASCAPRVVWPAMLHPRKSDERQAWIPGAMDNPGRFVTLTGIDPAAEVKTAGMGQWLDQVTDKLRVTDITALSPTRDWILISTGKARKQKIQRGEWLTVTTGREALGDSLEFERARFEVAGAFATKHVSYDEMTAFAPIETVRRLVAKDNDDYANEIAVRLKSSEPTALAETKQRLRRGFQTDPSFYLDPPIVLAAGDQEERTLGAVDHQRGLMKLVLFVIMVVAAFLVFATVSMMVTEKTHDIGVVAALGGTRAGVMHVFLTCGLAIALVGTVLGIISGCLTSIYLDNFNTWMRKTFDINLFPTEIYHLPRVPYDLDPVWISIVSGSSLVLGLLAAAIPAWRAMRQDPLASLRNG